MDLVPAATPNERTCSLRLLPKRALVALGLTIASVGAMLGIGVQTASATPTYWFSNTFTQPGIGTVTAAIYRDTSNNNVYEEVTVKNLQDDPNHCIEGWVDPYLNSHRPANVFVACRNYGGDGYYSGIIQLHWPRSSGSGAVLQGAFTDTAHVKLALCSVNVILAQSTSFDRYDGAGSPCYQSARTVGSIHDGSYNGMPWALSAASIQTVYGNNWVSGQTDMMPEYMYSSGTIDEVFQGSGGAGAHASSLFSGEVLPSIDGAYRAVMQSDGNFVIRDSNNNAMFATGTNGHPGAFITLQSDGNLVVYPALGQPALWSSGTFGAPNWRLQQHTDGWLCIWNGGVQMKCWRT